MDSENRGPELLGLMVGFLALTWACVLLRCFVRIHVTKAFQADDWLMVSAMLIFTLYGGCVFVGVHYGMGRHNASLPQAQEIQALKYQALATAIYIANMAFLKLSIALFLLRIAVQRRYSYMLKASMVIVTVWTLGVFLFDIFECSPVAFQWDYTIQGGTCVPGDSLVNAAYAFSVLSVLSDWFYALLPIFMLWSVRMNSQTKFAVVAILSLGVFASVATLVRIKYLIDLANMEDILYASTDTMIWTILEPGLGIIAASIVTLRPLLRALRVPGFSMSSSGPPHGGAHPTIGGSGGPSGPYIRSTELDELSGTTVATSMGGGSTMAPKSGVRVQTVFVVETEEREDDEREREAGTGRQMGAIRGRYGGSGGSESDGESEEFILVPKGGGKTTTAAAAGTSKGEKERWGGSRVR